MKTLFYGAGPLGSLYAHLFYLAGIDVTVLARSPRYDFIEANGLELINEITGRRDTSKVKLIKELKPDDSYDLVVVLIRKNKLAPVIEILQTHSKLGTILFMGNNALGFKWYTEKLPQHKLLFGFPGAGGGIIEQVVHYADRESIRGKRLPVTLGEVDGIIKPQTTAIKNLFENSHIPVKLSKDMDGWLKYHVALIGPMANGLMKHNCDNYSLAEDPSTIRKMFEAAREGGRVLRALGYRQRQPFKFNLFYWLPDFILVKYFQGLLRSKFAEVAFAVHANSAQDEIKELALEFNLLTNQTSVATPNIDELSRILS